MQTLKIIFISLAAVYMVFYLYSASKTGKTFKTMLFYALIGVLALMIVNLTGAFTGVTLPLNPYTVAGSAATSLPGVITFLVLNLFF